ncbi:hypothetical protein KC333_g9504, partial [Hortaea werneckii]
MFLLVVESLIIRTVLFSKPIASSQLDSSFGGNVAVRYTIWHPFLANSASSSTFGLHVSVESRTMWLSSTTILSSSPVASLSLMNLLNAFVTALSGVTSTILACLALWSGHLPALSPISLHLLSRSLLSDINGTTTTVTPPTEQNAGSMNIRLLPPPVLMTITTFGSPDTIAFSPSSCEPLNEAFGPSISLRLTFKSALLNFAHLSSSTIFLYFSRSIVGFPLPVAVDGHLMKWC